MLFKTSAIVETITWTLLIIGIVFSHFKWPLYDWILPIAGSLHGVLVLGYMAIVFFIHRSLRWGFRRMLVAEAVSVIPYAVLVFELWEDFRRQQKFYTLAIAAAAASSGRD